MDSKIKELEKAVLDYLESRPKDWKWGSLSKSYSKDETIRLFQKDQKFRMLILKEAVLWGINSFSKAAERKQG